MGDERRRASDEELFAAHRTGDRRAGRELYQRYFGRVRRYFLNKACQPADVEDLVSKLFLTVLDPTRSKIGEARNFAAYVMGIARNQWFAYLRERTAAREVTPNEAGLEAFEAYVEQHGVSLQALGAGETTILEREQQLRRLLDGLRGLSLIYQEVLELHFWEEMTFAELGQVLGVPTGTVASRVRLAKVRLYEAVSGVVVPRDDRRIDEVIAQVDEWARQVAAKVRGASPD